MICRLSSHSTGPASRSIATTQERTHMEPDDMQWREYRTEGLRPFEWWGFGLSSVASLT